MPKKFVWKLTRFHDYFSRGIVYHSQTEDGAGCAEALRRYYEGQGYRVSVREVPDPMYAESRFKMRGLRSLMATLIDLIRSERRQGREVIVNATGGFKAEIAYATLVGLLFDVPVYYIHEAFREIIEMPSTPISWDYSLLAEYEEFFEWISEDLRKTAEVDRKLRKLPSEIYLLLAEEEDFTMLSPAGEAFYEAYRGCLEQAEFVPVLLSGAAWHTYNSSEPSTRRLFERALKSYDLENCAPVAPNA